MDYNALAYIVFGIIFGLNILIALCFGLNSFTKYKVFVIMWKEKKEEKNEKQ